MKLKLIARILTANDEPQPLSTGPESPTNTLVNNLTPEEKELNRQQKIKDYNKEQYEQQKAEGLCPVIGCKNRAVQGKFYCQKHSDERKERREQRKEQEKL